MHYAQGFLRGSFLVLALILASCSGSAGPTPEAGSPGLPQVQDLDQLARSTSIQVPLDITAPLLSSGTLVVGGALAYGEAPGTLRYAVFRINPHVTELNSLIVGGEDGLNILLSDFNTKRWFVVGVIEHGFDQILLPQFGDLRSEAGYLYIAVVAPAGVVGLLTSLALDRGGPEHIYFVEPPGNGGSDANDGSDEHPWATLQHAADNCQPGTMVLVGSGVYDSFVLNAGGTAEAPISFVGTQPAEIHGQPLANSIVSLNDSAGEMAYVTLDSFTVLTNGQSHGIEVTGAVQGPAHHITLKNILLNGAIGSCISLDNVTDSAVTGCGENYAGTYALELVNGCQRVSISRNVFQLDTWGGVFCGAGSQDLTIDANYINGQSGTYAIAGIALSGSRIYNNLLINNTIGISLESFGETLSTGNDVFNNTVYSASDYCVGAQFSGGSPDTRVYNNIFIAEGQGSVAMYFPFGGATGIDSDYNILTDVIFTDDTGYNLSQWQAVEGLEIHSKLGTSADTFNNPGGLDFSLAAGSPAAGSALADYVPVDSYWGYPRYASPPDCGCI